MGKTIVSCEVKDCQHRKDEVCSLGYIEIEFNWDDEYRQATANCINYKPIEGQQCMNCGYTVKQFNRCPECGYNSCEHCCNHNWNCSLDKKGE